jgi:hypothetical protein
VEAFGGAGPIFPKLVSISDSQLRPIQHAAEQKLTDLARDFHAVPVERILRFAPLGELCHCRSRDERGIAVYEFMAQFVRYAAVYLPAHCGVEGAQQLVQLAPVEGRIQGIRTFRPRGTCLWIFVESAAGMAWSRNFLGRSFFEI